MPLGPLQVIETCNYLKGYVPTRPDIGLLTGTGLSESLDRIQINAELAYSDIPHFPLSTVDSHKGKLIVGNIEDKTILLMQGRFHLYEGYSPSQVTFPVRVMQQMGVQTLILSNAAGGINLNFKAGDIMAITDHINLTGQNPLIGPNVDAWGIRFPDMTKVYEPSLISLLQRTASDLEIPVKTGVYAGLSGPSLETPAETRYLKTIGADAVGFSTVMEAIAGVHGRMKILGLSLITNINNPDHPQETTLKAVLKTAEKAMKPLNQLLYHLILNLEQSSI